jgi:uncharacterized phage protein (TIGR01671 family)
MRERKYRCYFDVPKSMFYINNETDFTIEFGNEKPVMHIFCADGVIDSWDVDNLMEFTGLHDSKGVEIYEGDLLTHKYYKRPVVVSFKDGCFQAEDVCLDDNSLTVIGNIHQHPELMEA